MAKERERPDASYAHRLPDVEALQNSDFLQELLQPFLIAGSGPMIPETTPPALAKANIAKCKELDSAFFTDWSFDQCPQSQPQLEDVRVDGLTSCRVPPSRHA
ncbi:hypothetical protein MTO96_005111 [Rhipicephalus appendiculatus]